MLADICLLKLNNKQIKNLFQDICHSLPLETACRKTVLQISIDELQRMSNAVHNKQIFAVVDEGTLSGINI